ncbi:MAG: hypothetical protein LBE17_12125 [Treponema sp.]|jgi:MFS family permease|nr:hypothetical protein [Treponema sp.]
MTRAVFGFALSPLMGRLIDKAGYKTVMVADTLILIIVCLLYGFAHRLFPLRTAFIVVCINFVLTSIVSLASIEVLFTRSAILGVINSLYAATIQKPHGRVFPAAR